MSVLKTTHSSIARQPTGGLPSLDSGTESVWQLRCQQCFMLVIRARLSLCNTPRHIECTAQGLRPHFCMVAFLGSMEAKKKKNNTWEPKITKKKKKSTKKGKWPLWMAGMKAYWGRKERQRMDPHTFFAWRFAAAGRQLSSEQANGTPFPLPSSLCGCWVNTAAQILFQVFPGCVFPPLDLLTRGHWPLQAGSCPGWSSEPQAVPRRRGKLQRCSHLAGYALQCKPCKSNFSLQQSNGSHSRGSFWKHLYQRITHDPILRSVWAVAEGKLCPAAKTT